MTLCGADLPNDAVPLSALRRGPPPAPPSVTRVDPEARAQRVRLLSPRIAADYRDGHPAAAIRASYDLATGELYGVLRACGVPLRYPAPRRGT